MGKNPKARFFWKTLWKKQDFCVIVFLILT